MALEENDPKYFAKVLGNVARAKRMSSVSNDGNPRIDTLFRVLGTLEVKLGVTR